MAVAAPKIPLTGSHAVDVRKSKTPNVLIAGQDSAMRTAIIPTMKKITEKDAMAVREEKARSMGFLFDETSKGQSLLIDR